MNLLAHALLSPADAPALLVGNLTADWIKGRVRRTLPADFQTGFALHQRIDAFTDTHPLVADCIRRLADPWDRYAPVLVDIFLDHILTCQWSQHSAMPRPAFIDATYDVLRAHQFLLPPRARYAVHALLADDWFSCYASLDGIALSLSRLSNRLRHGVELAPAVRDFRRHQDAFHEAFTRFFPQLQRHVAVMPPLPVHCPA